MHLRLVVFHPDSLTFLESTGGLAHRLSLRQKPAARERADEYSGHDGLRRFSADFVESFEMFEVQYSDVRHLGDRVLGMGTLRTLGQGSGIENEGPVAMSAIARG
jgi:hypothetical protein